MATLCAAIMAVLVFFPAEGRVLAPLHAAIGALLGQTSFVLPLGLAFGGALGFAHRLRPDLVLPKKMLVGLGLITIGFLPADRLLGQSTGLFGDWFTQFLIDVLGVPLTLVITLILLGVGSILTFDLRRPRLAAG